MIIYNGFDFQLFLHLLFRVMKWAECRLWKLTDTGSNLVLVVLAVQLQTSSLICWAPVLINTSTMFDTNEVLRRLAFPSSNSNLSVIFIFWSLSWTLKVTEKINTPCWGRFSRNCIHQLTHEQGPGHQRHLTHSPSSECGLHRPSLLPEAASRTKPGESDVVLRPSG